MQELPKITRQTDSKPNREDPNPEHEPNNKLLTPKQSANQTIQILVNSINQHTISVQVSPTITVKELKELLATREGVPPAQQRLRYCSKEMHDGSTLQQYGVQQSSTIGLMLKVRCTESFLVKTHYGDVWMPYNPNMTVMDVKNRLADKGKVKQSDIELKVGSFEPSDDMPLGKLKESGGFIIFHAEWDSIDLIIRWSRYNEDKIKVQPSRTVASLIKQLCNAKALHHERYKLMLDRASLKGSQQFGSIDFVHGKVLRMVPRTSIIVEVMRLTASPAFVEIPMHETIATLKQEIQRTTFIHASRQIIIVDNNRELNDKETFVQFSGDYLPVYLIERMMHRH